jgi:hypothetical protein
MPSKMRTWGKDAEDVEDDFVPEPEKGAGEKVGSSSCRCVSGEPAPAPWKVPSVSIPAKASDCPRTRVGGVTGGEKVKSRKLVLFSVGRPKNTTKKKKFLGED